MTKKTTNYLNSFQECCQSPGSVKMIQGCEILHSNHITSVKAKKTFKLQVLKESPETVVTLQDRLYNNRLRESKDKSIGLHRQTQRITHNFYRSLSIHRKEWNGQR